MPHIQSSGAFIILRVFYWNADDDTCERDSLTTKRKSFIGLKQCCFRNGAGNVMRRVLIRGYRVCPLQLFLFIILIGFPFLTVWSETTHSKGCVKAFFHILEVMILAICLNIKEPEIVSQRKSVIRTALARFAALPWILKALQRVICWNSREG